MLGFARSSKRNRHKHAISNTALVTKVLEMFPDACPFYVRHLCIGKTDNPFDMDQVMKPLIRGDYPKNQAYKLDEGSFDENLNTLETFFPDADPNFLHYHAVLCLNDKNKLESCIASMLENPDYPIIRKNRSAIKNGQYYICNCCYDEEIKPRDLGTCENGCVFCKSCVLRSVEISYGEGKINFPCLLSCSAYFSLQTLEDVLPRKLYDKVAQKKQIEEIKAAQIENLEMCPFCDFAMIPVQEDKIFRCQNAECMKESCRLCKELTHLPLRCEEVTKPEEIQKRIYIENKMSEALIRACYKCGLKFIKSEGCNRMKCTCGAMMCYLCLAPVKDYKHFNGPGGDSYHLCPLFSDTDELHEKNITKGAESAKLDVLLNRHIPKTPNKPTSRTVKLVPTKPAPKPPTETNKSKATSVPPEKQRKRKAPPRPPPPVMQYISAIYNINNPSSSAQPPNNVPQAIPQRIAPPPPPPAAATSSNDSLNRTPRVPQRTDSLLASTAENSDNVIPIAERQIIYPRSLSLERNSEKTSIEAQRTVSHPSLFVEDNVDIIEVPQRTIHSNSSNRECHSDKAPVPAPRSRIFLNNKNNYNILPTAQQRKNSFNPFISVNDEIVTLPQHTIIHNVSSIEKYSRKIPRVPQRPHPSEIESFSDKIPVPAPRYMNPVSNSESSSDVKTAQEQQINYFNPFNLNCDVDETAMMTQNTIYPDLINLDDDSCEAPVIPQRKTNLNPFTSENCDLVLPTVSSATLI